MPEKWITRKVALYRGDCLDVLRTITSESVDAVIVDPPYGINWQSHIRAQRFPHLHNDARPFIWFLHDAFWVCRETGALLCFCIGRTQEVFRSAIETAGWKIRSQVIWDRVQHGMGDCHRAFAPQHDVMWFASKKDFRFHGRRPKSVLRHQKVGGGQLVHPTEKPVALMSDQVEYITPPPGRLGCGTSVPSACWPSGSYAALSRD